MHRKKQPNPNLPTTAGAKRIAIKKLVEGAARKTRIDPPKHPVRSTKRPALPSADANGNYPASETIQVLIAREIYQRRRAAGLTQVQLAKAARVRQETISRLESGKHAPNVRTVDRIDRALQEAGV